MILPVGTKEYEEDGQKVAVPLYDFQVVWMKDPTSLKIGKMARQIGKSFAATLEVVDNAMETGDDWVMLSAGERQSKELMQKVKMHCQAYMIAISDIETDSFLASDGIRYTILTIYLPNGARIMGLPANPDTARGFTGNLLLDEFAFHRDPKRIWAAVIPTVSRGFKVRVISTPQGMGNKYHSLWSNDNGWSKHDVDIYKAVDQGVPHDIQMLRDAVDDEEIWQQEYECKFIDEASTLLSYELILSCTDQRLEPEIDYEDFNLERFNPEFTGSLSEGVDIGRRKDRTVLWMNELLGDVFWNRNIVVANKVKFRHQQKLLSRMIRKFAINRTCIDSTGIGAQLAEDTKDEHGSHRVEEVDFTNSVKADLAVRTLRMFEDKRTRIPVSKKLRDDLHSVKKTTTAANKVRYDANRTKEGHADRFWALSLSLMASNEGAKPSVHIL